MRLKTFKLLLAAVVVAFASLTVQADPLRFSNVVALQNGGLTKIDLFSQQSNILSGPTLTFLIDVTGVLPPSGTDTLQITFTQAGHAAVVQSFQIPVFGTVPPPFTQLVTFLNQNQGPNPAPASLRIDLLNSSGDYLIPGGPQAGQSVDSYTFNFNVAQPVPEPASVLLLTLGCAGLAARLRSKRRI